MVMKVQNFLGLIEGMVGLGKARPGLTWYDRVWRGKIGYDTTRLCLVRQGTARYGSVRI